MVLSLAYSIFSMKPNFVSKKGSQLYLVEEFFSLNISEFEFDAPGLDQKQPMAFLRLTFFRREVGFLFGV